jgi:hypothetical protein
MAVSPNDIPVRKAEQDDRLVQRLIETCDKRLMDGYADDGEFTFWFNPDTPERIMRRVADTYLALGWSIGIESRDNEKGPQNGISFHGTKGDVISEEDAEGLLNALVAQHNRLRWNISGDFDGLATVYTVRLGGPLITMGDVGEGSRSDAQIDVSICASARHQYLAAAIVYDRFGTLLDCVRRQLEMPVNWENAFSEAGVFDEVPLTVHNFDDDGNTSTEQVRAKVSTMKRVIESQQLPKDLANKIEEDWDNSTAPVMVRRKSKDTG